MELVTLGEALVGLDTGRGRLDAVRTLDKFVGGAESNVAIGLARLGHRAAYYYYRADVAGSALEVADAPLARRTTVSR